MDVDPQTTPFERFRMALDELGPTFVKFGQVMSLRSDLLPKPLIEELQKLQDDAAPVDVELIKAVIRENIDQPWETLFLSFDENPLAAASLSQVHRAVLREGAAEVALKVQRPEIESKINRDLSILGSVAERMHQRLPGFPSASAISSRKWSGVDCESDLSTATWAAFKPPSKKFSAG